MQVVWEQVHIFLQQQPKEINVGTRKKEIKMNYTHLPCCYYYSFLFFFVLFYLFIF